MWARSLVVIAALAGTVHAEFDASPPRASEPVTQTPRLRIGHPGAKLALDKVAVTVEHDALGLTANLTLLVSTTDNAAGEAVMALELPAGARVTGVALTIGKTERMVAVARGSRAALASYEDMLGRGRDPVLVQWMGTAATGDLLEVRAFPLTTTERGAIELTIELPTIAALAIDTPAPTVEIASVTRKTYRNVKEPITVELPYWRELDLGLTVARPHVSATTSLYAGFAPAGPEVPIIFTGSARSYRQACFSPDKPMIRREIKRQMARLQHCYVRAYQYSPTGGPDADAVLHFTIDRAGKVAETSVDGTIQDPAITSCLAEVVGQLVFPAGDASTQVNYPLHFRLNR